jgi:tRNA pseudouridine55 synthase
MGDIFGILTEMPEDNRDIRLRPVGARGGSTAGGSVLNLYKRMGETPRERLERLRREKPQYAQEVLSYAGRLDPMAEGVMLALVGAANRRREEYLDMSKEYVLDVLFGFSTDTHDVLGRVMEWGEPLGISKRKIEQGLNEFRGSVSQEYPPFSSKTVEGKALFDWSKSGLIGNLVMPRKQVNVYDISLSGIYKLAEPIFYSYIKSNVEKVQGDFRQEEIMRIWDRHLRSDGNRQFPCATIAISCSSGTYARAIANGLGNELGIPALALHILRTQVGDYRIDKSLK